MWTLILLGGNCNRVGGGSATKPRAFKVLTGQLSSPCVPAENPAIVRTAPARAGGSVRLKLKMRRMLTLNNTQQRTRLAQRF
jgi:hypothetical protein